MTYFWSRYKKLLDVARINQVSQHGPQLIAFDKKICWLIDRRFIHQLMITATEIWAKTTSTLYKFLINFLFTLDFFIIFNIEMSRKYILYL